MVLIQLIELMEEFAEETLVIRDDLTQKTIWHIPGRLQSWFECRFKGG